MLPNPLFVCFFADLFSSICILMYSYSVRIWVQSVFLGTQKCAFIANTIQNWNISTNFWKLLSQSLAELIVIIFAIKYWVHCLQCQYLHHKLYWVVRLKYIPNTTKSLFLWIHIYTKNLPYLWSRYFNLNFLLCLGQVSVLEKVLQKGVAGCLE